MRAVAVHGVIAATLLGVPGATCAQYALNGHRLHEFAGAIEGAERNCQGRDGDDPKNPPNAMLANVNIGTACGQGRPRGTTHALKGLCNIGAGATQTDAETRPAVELASPKMAHFGVLSAAERSDAAESLRAAHPDRRRRSRGRSSALRAAARRPDPSNSARSTEERRTLATHVVNVGDPALRIEAAFDVAARSR